MIRRLPLIPTIVVAAAVAVMIGLGVWQLQRAEWIDLGELLRGGEVLQPAADALVLEAAPIAVVG